MLLDGKRILVTGGTGSLGQTVVRRLLAGEMGIPDRITVFSRDEAKQHYMRLSYLNRAVATDEVIYDNFRRLLNFQIGDMRDFPSILQAARDADVVINAAALKQVPTCEYFPYQAVQTNVLGAQNLVRAIQETRRVKTVVGISTDKACKPVNVMGMTKALMERIFIESNIECPGTRFICVRYGNVIASRGSVVPLFLDQIAAGGPVTITTKSMTRFLLSLDKAVDTVFAAMKEALPGEIYIPKVPAARIVDLALVLMDGRKDIALEYTGIRPGEKIHEIMVSEDEVHRTIERHGYYVIGPSLPELKPIPVANPALKEEYSSKEVTIDHAGLHELLAPYLKSQTFREATA